MQLFMKFRVFNTVTGKEVEQIRKSMVDHAMKSPARNRVSANGVFTDERGGFLVIDVNSSEELLEFFGPALLDNCEVETHPVASFDKLGEFFKKMG